MKPCWRMKNLKPLMKPQNKKKLKELLGKVNSLEQDSFPSVESKSLADEIINKEYYDTTQKIKESSTVKYLDAINVKLEDLKKGLDLGPIDGAINDLEEELNGLKTSSAEESQRISGDIENKLASLRQEISQAEQQRGQSDGQDKRGLSDRISILEAEVEMLSAKKVEIPDFGSQIQQTEKNLRTVINTLKSEVEGKDKSQSLQSQITDVQSSIKKAQKEVMDRISQIGGGSMNRQINVKSSVMSQKFTDINFANGGGISWTATDDTVNKRVNIVASIISAGTGGGSVVGTPASPDTGVQYNDGGTFGATSLFTYDKTTNKLSVASSIGITNNGTVNALSINQVGSTSASISVGGAVNINNTLNTGSGLVIYSNHGAGQIGRQFVVYSQASALTIDTAVMQSDATNNTTLNLKGVATGKGVLKVEHFGNTAGDSSGSGISIALGNGVNKTSVQGIFIDAPTTGTDGKLLNVKNAGSDKFVVDFNGATTINGAYTFPLADGTTNFALVTNGAGQLSFASVAGVGGSGITRQTSIITANTTGGSSALKDYIYIATAGMSFTLPDASGNLNLYTLKNASNSSVLVTSIGGDTIDGSGSVLSAINNQTLGFISDNTNWRIV